MNILQRIKEGNCYIRTEDDHDLALVINYCHDNKINWIAGEPALETLDCFKIIYSVMFKPAHLLISECEQVIPSHFDDITEQFFSETA